MKTKALCFTLLFYLAAPALRGQMMTTAFTYQGLIKASGSPVNGTCDFIFTLYNSGGSQVGSSYGVNNLTVANGLFTVQLDFGSAFLGQALWLQTQSRCPAASGSYATLSPRQALTAAPYALALPGLHTEINATSPNLIGGYIGNAVTAGVVGAVISGGGTGLYFGVASANLVTDDYGTVAGGFRNRAGDNTGTTSDAVFGTVGGGGGNTASAFEATVGGGGGNTASGYAAMVGGGQSNSASGSWATAGGGSFNTASGSYAAVPGGFQNVAQGDYSFAAGRRAKTYNPGCFVLADSTDADEPCYTDNHFIFRATNGFRVWTTANHSAGVFLPAGGNAWSSVSDRSAKENLAPVDGRATLALLASIPIQSWNYKSQDNSIRHMGPMAQDFYAAFGLGEDDKHISTVDADGVALAAITGLYQELKERDAKIATLEARLAELELTLKHWAAADVDRR